VESWRSQEFENRVSENLPPNLTPYEFQASLILQLLFSAEISAERSYLKQVFAATN